MKKLAPSEWKKQALEGLLNGTREEVAPGGPLSAFIKLSVEKMLQELLEQEQEAYLGRSRYRRREGCGGDGVYRREVD